ncbi:MAG: S8 family serine peptidase [Dokdonella sp.]|uniref:S8 family serine peptidase n=1 Tax=Dokdonella sp. TaxID=2291710 RepID=UPI003263D876
MSSRSIAGPCGFPLAALALACSSAFAAQVDPALVAQAVRDGRVETLIVLPDQDRPVLAPLRGNADYKLRRRVLVDTLRDRAQTQQASLVAWLSSRGVEHRAYWISNVVWARVSASDLAALATRSDVARVDANTKSALKLPIVDASTPAPSAVNAIEWGVNKINAPAVWALGYTGQGVVIAGEDTGYKWDHVVLKPQYRGWDGTTADHNYNWHDAIHAGAAANSCGFDMQAPCDDNGHGTHTAGTFAGSDGGSNQTGVAPGAKWIGCRNMDAGDGTPATYIECIEWMMAPTDLAGANPDPDRAPDVVSNSWGCIPSEGCTAGDEIKTAVDNIVAGGIFFAAAAANDGPGCSSITSPPAIYDSAFVVGATDSSDAMAGFSSRGPVLASSLIRPDVSGPGVNVRSAWKSGGYNTISGTSMATPHIAGAAALLMSVKPELKGHPDQVGELLRASATRQGITDPGNSGCGGLTMADWPNYQAGYGRVDVYAAAQLALAAPTLSKAFEPASIHAGESSTLTLTLGNAGTNTATVTDTLTDTFPDGLVVADPANESTTCTSGSVTATPGVPHVSLVAGAEIAIGETCTVTVDVTAAEPGSYVNLVPAGDLQTTSGASTGDAVATLEVVVSDVIFDDGFDDGAALR